MHRFLGSPEMEAHSHLTQDRLNELAELQSLLGYTFHDVRLLDRALTHKSYSYEVATQENGRTAQDYEAMEYLGDSILGFLIAEVLYLTCPDLDEGRLSKIKSFLVSTKQLFAISHKMGLGGYLNLSRGEAKTGGRRKKAILADLFESIVAAIYLDGGIDPVRRFVLTQFIPLIEQISEGSLSFLDHKSSLQELLHRIDRAAPVYEITAEFGPDHNKEFHVRVLSEGEVIAEGVGKSKKEAEQQAAKLAIERLS